MRHLLLLCCLLISSPQDPPVKKAPKPAQDVGSIEGFYSCKGTEAGGKPYSGVCVIQKKNDVHVFQWVMTGGSSFAGVGVRQGDTIAVGWAIPGEKGIIRGVNVYRVEQGPRLVGRWASLPGPGIVQDETLTFLKKLDVED